MKCRCILALALAAAIPGAPARADYIQDYAKDFKEYFKDAEPTSAVDKWLAPFQAKERGSIEAFRVVSTYGSPRQSVLKGHWHSGLDMSPKEKGQDAHAAVFAIARGVVVSIHLADPHHTVVVKHKLADGSTLFSSYKHLQSAFVEVGQQVDTDTKVGQLFTKAESKKFGGDFDHLHFEVRTSFDDYGVASWATMSKPDLDKRFLDPLAFFKSHLK